MFNLIFIILTLIILSFLHVKKTHLKYVTILTFIFLMYFNLDLEVSTDLIKQIGILTTSLLIIYLAIKESENEEYLLIVLAMIGLYTLAESTNLFTLFLALELQSFIGYTLVRNHTISGNESSLKYFLVGTIASALFILGSCLIYGQTGLLDYITIFEFQEYNNILINLGTILLLIALIFKIGASPFHIWLPDVYAGASYETLLFISIFPKIFLFILLKNLTQFLEMSSILVIA